MVHLRPVTASSVSEAKGMTSKCSSVNGTRTHPNCTDREGCEGTWTRKDTVQGSVSLRNHGAQVTMAQLLALQRGWADGW